jgi:ell wall binding domain 2 (CWB2)
MVGIASGVGFADALAGGTHAGILGGPLLLTAPDTLPPATHDYLVSVKADVGFAALYGGTNAISDGVDQQVRAALR